MAAQDTLRSIFAREIHADGGIADPLILPEDLRPMLSSTLTHFREVLASTANAKPPRYIAPNIYVDIIDNPTVNAVSFESSGHEFVGVNVGSIFFIYDAFLSLFSHPKFMPDVGNADSERTTNNELLTWLQRKDITHIHEFSPLDEKRARAAQFLTLNAYNFILAHEVGHIGKGHLKYLEKSYGLSKNFAYADKLGSQVPPSLHYVLEVGADENAAHGSLHMFKPHKSGKMIADSGGLLCDFRTWTISIGVVFALFDRQVELHNAEALFSHPPPDIRFLNVLWSAWEEIKKIVPEEFEAAISQSLEASKELNAFFAEIGMTTRPFLIMDQSGPSSIVRRDLLAEVAALRNRLHEIEEKEMASLAAERSDTLRQTGRTLSEKS